MDNNHLPDSEVATAVYIYQCANVTVFLNLQTF